MSKDLNLMAIFPGQGSQSVGMGKDLFENFKVYKETIEEASDALSQDLKKLCFEGPIEDLNLTANTQPAIVASSIGAFNVLKSESGFIPSVAAGHSVGEYSALAAAGVFNCSTAVKAVKIRGKAMQEAVPVGEGGMLALIGPSDEQGIAFCKWVESQNSDFSLEAANFNCPGQLVLSGNQEAIDWAKTKISEFEFEPKPRKVRLIPLKVSAPFHSKLMWPAEEVMRDHLENVDFKTPNFEVVQNINAQSTSDIKEIKENLIQQISGSILWTKSIASFINKNTESDEKSNTYVEVGSGTTLTGLIKKIDTSEIKIFNTIGLEDVKSFVEFYSKLNS